MTGPPGRIIGILRSGRLADLVLAAALTVAQALLVAPLFAGPYTQWRQSIEAAFITDARTIVERFPDLSWSPLWYLGFPFELFYTPLLPVATALLGWVSGDVAGAYRVVAATGFALGAGGLYVLARSLGAPRATAVLATALFACAPLASYLLPGLAGDGAAVTGSPIPLPWRLVVLVEYGEGPHVLGLALALFASAAVIAYLRERGAVRFWLAAALLVAVALTNLIAMLGAAVIATMAVLAVGGDPPGGSKDPGRIRRGAILAGTVAILSLVWYSPGFVSAVAGFSTPGGDGAGSGYLLFPVVIGAAAILGRLVGRRDAAAGIVVSSGLVFATILAAWYLRQTQIAPQPIRYALELDAVAAIGLALGIGRLTTAFFSAAASPLPVGAAATARMPGARAMRPLLLAAAAALVLVISGPGWLAVQSRLAPDRDWESWSERRVALWLRDHLGPGQRAYLSGSHAFWADVFADVPQVRGGVDFAGLDPWWAHATYQINTGSDPAVSARWLRALGVRYAVVTGPDSRDAYRDFAKPGMFEGLLPLAATVDGARIYEVAGTHAAPVLIEHRADPPQPRDALDGATLERYLAAIDAGVAGSRLSLRATGLGSWEGSVQTHEAPLTLLLPTAHDAGWRVQANGRTLPTRSDTVGLLAVDLPRGAWDLRIDHRVHGDLLLGNAAAFAFLAVIAGRRALRHAAGRQALPPVAIVGAVVLTALALGVVGGYPKGTDAPMHLARLQFVSDWFPNHGWLYAWANGMPAFDTYPALPYLAGLPLVRLIGAEATLQLLALLAFGAIGLGIYGHLVERGRPPAVALVASLMAISSVAVWTWVVNGGVYARPIAVGLGALAWWAHARALRTEDPPRGTLDPPGGTLDPRGGRARWWTATAILLAAAVSSHQVLGAIPALYVAFVQLSARGVRGIPRLAWVAGVSALFAAPALVPAIAGGLGGTFIGAGLAVRPSPPDVLWDLVHVGPAAFVVPLALVVLELTVRPVRALAAGTALAAATLYVFAPNLGIPTSLYYVTGIEPFTMTFVLAIVGALVAAALMPSPATPRGRVALVLAGALVATNVVLAVPTFAAHRDYPQVIDTTDARWPEEQARRSIVVDGGDLRHRFLPLSADEAVWFTYSYRKPMVRDYYATGRLHADWLAWAYEGVYAPPLSAARVAAVLDWYAVDGLTVPAGHPAEATLAALPFLRPIPATAATPFHGYTVVDPSTIVVRTGAPIVVIVADRLGYDRAARLLFEDVATPRTRIPVWWDGTLADVPADLSDRAAALLVVGDQLGPPERAVAAAARAAERGTRVVWDLAGVGDGPLAAPWPAATVAARPIGAFDVTDRASRIDPAAFSPARYGDGPWGAQVLTSLGPTAQVELGLGADALVATASLGRGSLTAIGGNLLYHALAYGNAAERSYVLSFLGPASSQAAVEPDWTFVDPERREVRTDGSVIVLKESIHPSWTATWRGPEGAGQVLPIRYAGPGLMLVLPPGPGLVTFDYGASPAQLAGWGLFAAGLGVAGWGLRRRRPAGASRPGAKRSLRGPAV